MELETAISDLCLECELIEFIPETWKSDSNKVSNSLGNPYFEQGEQWPISIKTGKPLHYVFQCYNNGGNKLPDDIQLLQVFVDLENIPFATEDSGLLIKTYPSINFEKIASFENQIEIKKEMVVWKFKTAKCAPSWSDLPDDVLMEILKIEKETQNSDLYNDIKYKLEADNTIFSKIGGYPGWYQDTDYPTEKDGKVCSFILDVHKGLKWAWMGAIYLFWNENKKLIEYRFQST